MNAPTAHDVIVGLAVSMPGLVARDPFTLGPFEFTTRTDFLPGCEKALVASFQDHGQEVPTTLQSAGFRVARTFFKDVDSLGEAIGSARLHLIEALALLATQFLGLLQQPVATGAGYTFDLKGGQAQPILHNRFSRPTPGVVAWIDEIAQHPTLTVNTLLSVHPSVYGELGSAVRRSTHWTRLAEEAEDWTERFLLSWMAAETLTRAGPGDTLQVKWLAALGFAAGRYGRGLHRADVAALTKIPTYRRWLRDLQRLLDRARRVRNAIAHSGFRELDVGMYLDRTDRLLVARIFTMLVPRLRSMALSALALRVRSVGEMWRRYAACFYFGRAVPLATEVGGTIIYSLEQPAAPWETWAR